jgi:hypothetical protein
MTRGSWVTGPPPAPPPQFIDQLAGQYGSSLVGFQQGEPSTVPQTVQGVLRETISPSAFGADPTGATSSTAAVQNAFNSGLPVHIPRNTTYRVDGTVTVTAATLSVFGEGGTSKLDFSNGGRLVIQSSPTALPSMSGDLAGGENTVGFSSDHGLVIGDVFAVYNPTNFSFSNQRSYYRDGCMFRVSEVISSTSVRVYGSSPYIFTAASVQCWKIPGGEVELRDFHIIPPSTGTSLIIDGHKDVSIGRVQHDPHPTAGSASVSSIEIRRSFDINVNGLRSSARAATGQNAYSLIMSNVQNVTVSECKLYSTWHSVSFGGTDAPACVPNRNIIVDHCILQNSQASGIGAVDAHGNCDGVVFSNSTINVANPAGRNISLLGCTIYGRVPSLFPDGLCVFGSEVAGGHYRIHDCTFLTFGTAGVSFSLIYFDLSTVTSDFSLSVKNIRVVNNGTAVPTNARIVRLELGNVNLTTRVDVDINGVKYTGTGNPTLAILTLGGTRDLYTSSLATAIIDNISASSGTLFVAASNATNYQIPMRLMRQSGVYAGTTTVSVGVIAAPISFRYPYPRIPQGIVGVRGTGGVATTTIGGQTPIAGTYSITTAAIRPALMASANFTAGTTYEQPWQVEINDPI